MSIIVTGASGLLGRRVAELLMERVDVPRLVLVTRRPEELTDMARHGVEVRRGDFDDEALIREALQGGERMLLISTDAIGRREVQNRTAVAAAAAAGVRHVAYTSMLNPVPENPAIAAPEHRATEDALRESGMAWTFLRNGLYAELEIPPAAMALASGQLVTNARDGRTAYVSRDDCAAVAAEVLATDGHEGQAYDVTGPELMTKGDEAELLTELTGRPVRVVDVDDATLIAELDQAMPHEAAVALVSFGAAIRGGYLDQLSSTVHDLAGRKPLALRDVFADGGIGPEAVA